MNTSVLVLGATGLAGRGVLAAAAELGRPVIAVGRQMQALREVVAKFPGAAITALQGSVADARRSAKLVGAVRKLGRPIGGVVSALGGHCDRGRLDEQSAQSLREAIETSLYPQANAARHLLPLLADSGRCGGYVVIAGPEGELPWAGYGHRAIVNASLRMLARVLHEEARSVPARVQLLAVESPLRDDANPEHACDSWPSPLAVGRQALRLLQPTANTPTGAIVRFSPPSGDHFRDVVREDARALLDSLIPRT
jgi:NAD(P)-dependent dehydrogenase (short-subunit alcohol dehydrogenase family)